MNPCCQQPSNLVTYRKEYGKKGRGGFELGIRCWKCKNIRIPDSKATLISAYHQQMLATTLEHIYQEGIKFDNELH